MVKESRRNAALKGALPKIAPSHRGGGSGPSPSTWFSGLTRVHNQNNNNHHHHHLFAQINWTRRRTHDQHENKSRTRKAQKTGAYILPIKKTKKNKHTRYKNNYDYAYRKNAEKSTRLSDRLNLDNDEKSTVWGKKFQTFIILSIKKFLDVAYIDFSGVNTKRNLDRFSCFCHRATLC